MIPETLNDWRESEQGMTMKFYGHTDNTIGLELPQPLGTNWPTRLATPLVVGGASERDRRAMSDFVTRKFSR